LRRCLLPTIPYKNSKGEKVKGTTTILGNNLAWGARALQWWYHSKGLEGIEYKDIFKHTGADIGTVGHALITDFFLKGKPIPDTWVDMSDEDYGKARQALNSFMKWAENMRFEPYATEINMVSEKHQVGLTPDIIGRFPNGLGLVDLKTGNAIYDSHILQMSMYFNGWHEVHPDEPLTEGIHVLRIGKDNANFTHHWWQELPPEAFEAFLLCKRLEEIHPLIEALIK
jgi:hypothetical protein